MKYQDSYFEDEVRAGFYIDSKMKCAWAAQIEVLNRIDEICDKYNIQYFVEWGSMLGTVRHGGFVPWDDDLDISMKRVDFERFLKVAKDELPEYYHVLSYHDAGYYDIMARVINGTNLDFSNEFLDEYHNTPFVCGVDIFPIDYVARDKKLEKLQYDIVMFLKTLADVSSNDPDFFSDEEFEAELCKAESLTGQTIDRSKNIKE